MTFNDKDAVNRVLSALGEELARRDAPPSDILVCGGSALHALGLIRRTTRDVDVLAVIGPDDALQTAEPLPVRLSEVARRVSRLMSLPEDWLNPGPASALDLGLPEGVLSRAEVQTYGDRLTVRFISRYDQIHFKLYAAADVAGKHLNDLKRLTPTATELEAAARWTLTHDVSPGWLSLLKNLLVELGHSDVAQKL